MNVYFYIDELNRDAITASKLKKRLENKGHKIVYGSRTTIKFLKYFHYLFDVIIITRPGLLTLHFQESWLKWKEKIVTLSTESVGIICEDHALMSKTLLEREYFEGDKRFAKRIDLYALWGLEQYLSIKKFANELLKKCRIIGHPRYDSFVPGKRKNDPKIKIVGVLARSYFLNDYYNRSSLSLWGDTGNLYNSFEYFKNNRNKLPYKRNSTKQSTILQTIDVDSTFLIIQKLDLIKNVKIIFRPHPRENHQTWRQALMSFKKIEFHDVKYPISDLLEKVDYLISPPTTSFYDAILHNVVPISTCSIDKKRKLFLAELSEDNNNLMKYIFKPESINDILYFIKKKKKFRIKTVENILHKELNFPECKNSLDNLVSHIEILKKKEKKTYFFLTCILFLFEIYFLFWSIKNIIIGRKSHSAYFALNFKIKKFINNLSNQTNI